MAWTEDGFENCVLAPRRLLRERMADRLDDLASGQFAFAHGRGLPNPHHLRALAARLRQEPAWPR